MKCTGIVFRSHYLFESHFCTPGQGNEKGGMEHGFDLVILGPPKFAYSQHQVESACWGYKDINLLAMQLIVPGGILFIFSCSGRVSPDLFQKVLSGASVDAARDVQIVAKLSQASDHLILLTFPESEYLKGLVCRVF